MPRVLLDPTASQSGNFAVVGGANYHNVCQRNGGGIFTWPAGADDEDTSYANDTVNTHEFIVTFPVPGDVASVTSYNVIARARRGSSPIALSLRAWWAGAARGLTACADNAAYTDNTLAPGAVQADLINADFGAQCIKGAGGTDARVTSLYGDLDYIEQAGGFSFFFTWILPLLGAAVTFADFHRAMGNLRTICPFTPRFTEAEIRDYWRSLQRFGYRTYCFEGVA